MTAADPGMAKAATRRRLRRARRLLPAAERERETAATVAALWDRLAQAPGSLLASYNALGSELSLAALHRRRWEAGLGVVLPRVIDEGRLAWHRVDAPDDLRPGAYAIAEPDPARCPSVELSGGGLLLVPGVGFGPGGRRLGQGGGFYDRLLGVLPEGLLSIGIGFSCQWDPALPCEAHDQCVARCLIGGRERR